ncbi:MAG: hypothetical protein WAL95_06860 [Candidatus Acidiferrales bacterium]
MRTRPAVLLLSFSPSPEPSPHVRAQAPTTPPATCGQSNVKLRDVEQMMKRRLTPVAKPARMLLPRFIDSLRSG